MENNNLFIRLVTDINDYNVFDRTYIESSTCLDAFNNIDWDNFDIIESVYELTEEGAELFHQWSEDSSKGYDLCNGRASGVCRTIGGRVWDIWEYLTAREYLAKKVEK